VAISKKQIPTEEQILAAASKLLAKGGVAAVTTRAVCEAAGVTAPTLYHHFGDKDGLLSVLVAQGVTAFMGSKRANQRTSDALADLERGWGIWTGFALDHPQLFRLMVESTRNEPSVDQEAFDLMRAMIERLAAEGRLTTDAETAARTIWAASNGVLSLFMQGVPADEITAAAQLLFDALIAKLVRTGEKASRRAKH
jgi:AcrR family transcriptional regulator